MHDINTIINSDEYKRIETDVESFVEKRLKHYRPVASNGKTIHDPVWGSIEYQGWEMQIIDSPLFQRLRDIHQVGLAMLTYPAARHSRFEHSLGVASAAKLMCDRINKANENDSIPDDVRNCIVLAALLHDIGHCFYSHLSESVYGEIMGFPELRRVFTEELELKPKPHEILSFIIINSKAFRLFFTESIAYPLNEKSVDGLLKDVGCMIIGEPITKDGIVLSYQTSIINGPFDADKLDYIKRDSYTAGLALQYDIERLFTKVRIHQIKDDNNNIIEKRLVIDINGITAVEELTFCKIMLFSYIYYHQKVLISESLIKDIAYSLCKLGVISSFSGFLENTDSEFLHLVERAEGQPFEKYGNINLAELVRNITNRNLPKRCFEISQANIVPLSDVEKDDETKYCTQMLQKIRSDSAYDIDSLMSDIIKIAPNLIGGKKMMDISDIIDPYQNLSFEEMLAKRQVIYKALTLAYEEKGKSIDFSIFDVHIVFPNLVNYGSMAEKVVLGKDQQNLLTINDFVKLNDWADSFNSNKWRGYVFVSEKIDINIAFRVSEKIILGNKARLRNPQAYLKGLDC
ncbi:MAG: HD domain-containing protein [Clostridiales bacterium]|nr:HD domain-containing protein [Clostridiales bacterium]